MKHSLFFLRERFGKYENLYVELFSHNPEKNQASNIMH
jgi:hypothetical protein